MAAAAADAGAFPVRPSDHPDLVSAGADGLDQGIPASSAPAAAASDLDPSRSLNEAIELLLEAKRPLIWVGSKGAAHADAGVMAEALNLLVESNNLPFVLTPMAEGFLPDGHRLCVASEDNWLLHGNLLKLWSDVKFIIVSAQEAEIELLKPNIGVLGDAKAVLESINAQLISKGSQFLPKMETCWVAEITQHGYSSENSQTMAKEDGRLSSMEATSPDGAHIIDMNPKIADNGSSKTDGKELERCFDLNPKIVFLWLAMATSLSQLLSTYDHNNTVQIMSMITFLIFLGLVFLVNCFVSPWLSFWKSEIKFLLNWHHIIVCLSVATLAFMVLFLHITLTGKLINSTIALLLTGVFAMCY
uniref:Thiamine pyrophosphate enzyme central domain-containing protein n=1 Tax=Oryza meridionalis TaxID=40149 RepID=A0A0E0EJ24_9ORYZ